MPFIINKDEMTLFENGVIVATVANKRYRCPKCALGEMRLVREVVKLSANEYSVSPAAFECNNEACNASCPIAGDVESGAVFPVGFGAPGPQAARTQEKPPFKKRDDRFKGNWGSGWE